MPNTLRGKEMVPEQEAFTPARDALKLAIDELNIALRQMHTAQVPVNQYDAIRARAIRERQQYLEGDLCEIRSRYADAIAQWVAGGATGEHPRKPQELANAERRLHDLSSAADYAERAAEPFREAYERAVERVRHAQEQRGALLGPAVAESLSAPIEQLNSALIPVWRIERRLASVLLALREVGQRGLPHSTGMLAAAEQIENAIARVSGRTLSVPDLEFGRGFLDQLSSDAFATL